MNLEHAEFEYDPEDPEGYRAGRYQPGPAVGATRTGISVYEIPPGQAVCPYHYEYTEEEWLLVLDGQGRAAPVPERRRRRLLRGRGMRSMRSSPVRRSVRAPLA